MSRCDTASVFVASGYGRASGRKGALHCPHEVSFTKGLPKHHSVRLQHRSAHDDVGNGPGPEDRLEGGHAASRPQHDVDDHHVGLATRRGTYGVAFGRSNASNLVLLVGKHFRERHGDHGIVFDDEDPQALHNVFPRAKSLGITHMIVLQKWPVFRDRTCPNSLGGFAPAEAQPIPQCIAKRAPPKARKLLRSLCAAAARSGWTVRGEFPLGR